MPEVKKPLTVVEPWGAFSSGEDGALVIEPDHTHGDILRYVISDVGIDHVRAILDAMEFPNRRKSL